MQVSTETERPPWFDEPGRVKAESSAMAIPAWNRLCYRPPRGRRENASRAGWRSGASVHVPAWGWLDEAKDGMGTGSERGSDTQPCSYETWLPADEFDVLVGTRAGHQND